MRPRLATAQPLVCSHGALCAYGSPVVSLHTAATSLATAHLLTLRACAATRDRACQCSPRRTCRSVMRLLKCCPGDDGFVLTTIDDNHGLPYTVLSHT
ncbi:hypothetical protein CC86DRAFT_419921 [Ophiobolus disseminans]|uniref:Uncharacterized protein n=1 Tax=Ophiobolus disseminans TaxID=1469910 RepID=A0A6A6ZV79_9PLEO|nr:hypothetical protein CC86DRAFT_419921 [Ophiobolus disseminans]